MKDDIKQAPENGSLQPQTQKAVSHDSPENIKGNSETKMCNCGKYPGQPCRCLEDALKANSVHAHSQEHCCCGHHHETSETSSSSKSETECCSHEHGTHCCESHSHEHQECCSAHNHHEHHECHSHEHAGCGCKHHHEEKHEHHESHACCAEHVHSHDKHCCCGHDHSHVENSMDTDWNVSEVKPTQYKLLFATLGSLAGVHDVNLTPEGLRIIHTPESLPAIEEAFSKNNLKLKRVVDNKKQTSQIRIPQMDCPTEEGLIRKKLNGIEGVSGLQFNLMNRILTVSYLPGQLPVILAAIKSLEYDPEVIEGQKTSLSEFKPTKINWWRYIFCLILALGSEACELLNLNEYVSIALAVAAILFVGVGTYKKGFIAIKNLNFNMNALMAVAVTGAVLIGSWAEAAMVMVLFEISEAIEQLSLDKARGAIRSLLSMTPQKATVQKDGKWEEIEADDVRVGDTVRVEPGERLAVDGKVISGNSSLNQSAITGESLPVDKKPGDAVFAGSLNENSELIYEATSTAQNSMPARIISAIESAQSSRAPTQRFVDSFAKVYTPLVFLIALATAVIPSLALDGDWYGWIYKALTLLVIACPCALVISTPVTIVTGLANAAKRGILVKGGIYLEKGRKLQLIAFDKTGTITEGKPQVQEVEMLTDVDPNTVLTLAAALADRNSHPVSKAVSEHAAAHGLQGSKLAEVNDFTALPGQGVVGTIEGTEYYLGNLKGLDRYLLQSQTIRDKFSALAEKGCSPLVLASSKKVLACFGVADSIKSHSKEAIEKLNSLGLKTVLLSGDNSKTAERIGKEVGVQMAKGNLLPEEKQHFVDRYAKKDVTGMVGDGINDAPALARADIGFAMGAAGTDTAIETADVALMDDDLRKLPAFIELSKETFKILCQNIIIALSIKAIFFALTFLGMATMWMAVFADTGTCLIVVANGLRLLTWKPSK